MITYPYDYYFSEDSVQTDIVITDGTASYSGTSLVVTGNTVLFTNENIDSEKMSLLETLCSDNTLRWGRCEASEFKFTIHSSVVPLEGTVLNAYLYFNNDASTLFKIGTYKVDSDVATALRTVREITCYDALLDVLNAEYIDWYNALDFDTVNTIKKFRDAFFTHVGITQKTVSLINDSVAVSKLSTESLTGSQILNAICEINGRFGHIDRDGKFAYIKLEQNIQGLYPAVDLYPSPTLYPQKPKSTPIASGSYIPPLKYEKYKVPSITRLQIRTDDSDIGVVVGTVGTDYVIQGNFLTFNLTGVVLTGIANNILGEISGVVFQPFEVQMRANLCFEVGDAIRCNDDLTGVEGYILYRNAVGIQAIIDTLNCMKERDYKLDANSVGYQFNAVNNKTATLKQDIDEVSATLTEQLDSTEYGSYAWQTAQQIGAKVDVEYGNHTTDSFSWDMDITGHTWYKNNQQVMKIDGTGLTVTGTIVGSAFLCGNSSNYTTEIRSDGMYAKFANGATYFQHTDDGSNYAQLADGVLAITSYANGQSYVNLSGVSGGSIELLYIGGTKHALMQSTVSGGYVFEYKEDSSATPTSRQLAIGSGVAGTLQIDKVSLNGSTWVHVGVSSPSIHIGNSDSTNGSTDLRIQAKNSSSITFKYGNSSTTLASILSDISSASSTASSAYNKADACATAILAINQSLGTISQTVATLVSEARSHGWNV